MTSNKTPSVIFNTLSDLCDGAVTSLEINSDMPTLVVKKESLMAFFTALYNHPDYPFQFLTSLCGVHYPEESPPVLGVVYHFHNLTSNLRLRIKSFTPVDSPVFPSLTGLFSAANWMEREAYDFYGIQFEGHPDLRRILNEDDMDYFPMRKEYPLEDTTRTDKNDAMFGR